MKRTPKPEGSAKPRHGPEPIRLKIEGDLGDAITKILRAGKPPEKKPGRPKRR